MPHVLHAVHIAEFSLWLECEGCNALPYRHEWLQHMICLVHLSGRFRIHHRPDVLVATYFYSHQAKCTKLSRTYSIGNYSNHQQCAVHGLLPPIKVLHIQVAIGSTSVRSA
jgi:hypothetical protein